MDYIKMVNDVDSSESDFGNGSLFLKWWVSIILLAYLVSKPIIRLISLSDRYLEAYLASEPIK